MPVFMSLALFAASVVAASEEKPVITVPADLCGDYFMVAFNLPEKEGRPDDRTLWMIYDTGADYSVIDPDSVLRVSGTEVAGGNWVRFEEASIGALSVRGLRAKAIDLDHLSTTLGREIDGIMGYPVFDGFLVTLDYAAGVMTAQEGALPRPDGETVFSVRGPDRRPWLRTRIAGKRKHLLIDTGSNGSLSLDDLDEYPTKDEPVTLNFAARLDHLERRQGARLDGALEFGPYRVVDPMLSSVGGSELIGTQILRHFRTTYDIANRRARFEQVAEDPLLTPSSRMTGAFFKPSGRGLTVTRVVPGSPAEQAGLAEGDLITGVNGKPVRDRGCLPMASAGEKTVRVLRGSDSFETTLGSAIAIE